MTLAQKMLSQAGYNVSDTAGSDNNQDNNQTGSNTGGTAGTGDNDGGASGGSPNDDNKSGQGVNGGQGSNDAGAAGGSSDNGNQQPEPDEVAIIAGLAKKGIVVSSLAELQNRQTQELTPEQKQEIESRRQNEKRTFALSNGKVTSTQFDDYARESSLPVQDLGFLIYRNERLQELKADGVKPEDMPDEQTLLADFNETHHLFASETDAKRRAGEKMLKKQVDDYLHGKYANIYSLDSDFEEHASVQTQRAAFSSTVNEAFDSIGTKMTFEITDIDGKTKVSYPVTFTPAEINAAKATYESDETFNALGKGKTVKKEDLAAAAKASVTSTHLQKIINDVTNAHLSVKLAEIKKGRREIIANTDEGDQGQTKVSPGVKRMLEKNKQYQTT